MDDTIKSFLEQQIRDRPKGIAQVELLGVSREEAIAALQRICMPLARELGLQIWANPWPTSDVIWAIKWKPKASGLKMVVNGR